MPQKWYQKVSVQTALVTGVFAIVTSVIIGFSGLYQGWFTATESRGNIHFDKNDTSSSNGSNDAANVNQTSRDEKPINKQNHNTVTDERAVIDNNGKVVEITRIRNLKNTQNWHGPIPPVAQIDVWLRYKGSEQLFINAIKFYHLETRLCSASSGTFPASHRYTIEYEPGSVFEKELSPPPLIINPSEQQEIHFEMDISPKDSAIVGGWSACIAFLEARTDTGLSVNIPLFSPLATDIVKSRILGRTLVIDIARIFEQGWYRDLRRIPMELQRKKNLCRLSPDGSIFVKLLPAGIVSENEETMVGPTELSAHLDKLLAIAKNPAESESISAAAVSLLGSTGGQSTVPFLREVLSSSASFLKREAASHALRVLDKGKEDEK